jgi:hypothetical protein
MAGERVDLGKKRVPGSGFKVQRLKIPISEALDHVE